MRNMAVSILGILAYNQSPIIVAHRIRHSQADYLLILATTLKGDLISTVELPTPSTDKYQ
jgi:hypothetical protein